MRKAFITLTFLGISTLACSLPVTVTLNTPATGTQTEVPLALTITAQALTLSEVSNKSILETNTPLTTNPDTESNNLAITPTPSFTPTTQPSPTPIFTATPTTPMVSVTINTNCRKGPGQVYDVIGALLVGETAEVVGINSSSDNWIVKNPDNPSSTCWIWREYATIAGDQSGLPEVSIPPTPTPTQVLPPSPVSNLQGNGSCDDPGGGPGYHLHTVSGTINWKDNANNEQGFNIYADYFGGDPPSLLGSSGANATSYAFSALTIDNPFALLVESYNTAGASKRVSVNIPYNCHP